VPAAGCRSATDGEDLVEATLSRVEVLEIGDQELGPAGLDKRCVSARGGPDHLLLAVDRSEMAGL
jgi:hypothetical protein